MCNDQYDSGVSTTDFAHFADVVRVSESRGSGGVLVTHSEAAARSADRIVVLDHGKLREHAAV
jgi:ABC-type multidrug transport system fused ATPase/permease subunit